MSSIQTVEQEHKQEKKCFPSKRIPQPTDIVYPKSQRSLLEERLIIRLARRIYTLNKHFSASADARNLSSDSIELPRVAGCGSHMGTFASKADGHSSTNPGRSLLHATFTLQLRVTFQYPLSICSASGRRPADKGQNSSAFVVAKLYSPDRSRGGMGLQEHAKNGTI
jgi:hypothetical protein